MHIDPFSAFIFNTVGSFLMSVFLFAVSGGYLGEVKGVRVWATALLVQTISLVFIVLFKAIPTVSLVISGYTLGALSLALYFHALVKFKQMQITMSWVYGIVIIDLVTQVYFTLVNTDISIRISIQSLCFAVLMFANGFLLLSRRQQSFPVSHYLTSGIFLCGALIALTRSIYYGVLDTSVGSIFDHNFMQDITYLSTYFITGILSFGFVLMCNDQYMTEKNQAQLAQEEALERLQKIARHVPGMVFQFSLSTDGDFSAPYSSDGIQAIFGVSSEQVREDASVIFERIYTDDYSNFVEAIHKSANDLTTWSSEFRVQYDGSNIRWLAGHAAPQREQDGSTLWHGFVTDITEHKKIAETHTFLSQTVHQRKKDSFFISLAQYLVHCLEMDFVCIDRLEEDGFTAQTLTIYHNGVFEHNIRHTLKDTPFMEVIEKHGCCFPANVCQLFPKDELLKTLNAESYLGAPLWSSTGEVIGFISVIGRKPLTNPSLAESILDIVIVRAAGELERKQAETELRIAATVFESQEGMLITDLNGIIIKVNHAFTEITGYSAEEAIGQTPHLLNSGRHDKAFFTTMWHNISDTGLWQGEIWNRRKNGDCYPQWLSITAVKENNDQGITHYVATLIDITERKNAEETIKQLAFYDALTDLPNRRLLQERLKQGIEINHRTDSQMAVLMMDLDKFKAVNDSLGHAAGDELLQQVAKRIKASLREVDMVARLGGDEFVVVIENFAHYEDVACVAESIINALSQPFTLNQTNEVHIGASIGIAIHPVNGDNVETLMDNADTALYRAKDNGRGCFVYYLERQVPPAHVST